VTHTEAVPDIDARTKEELQPTCDVRQHLSKRPCGREAIFIVTVSCDSCGSVGKDRLLCAAHAAHLAGGGFAWCPKCGAKTTGTVERLERLR
jgi:hypothetical protein